MKRDSRCPQTDKKARGRRRRDVAYWSSAVRDVWIIRDQLRGLRTTAAPNMSEVLLGRSAITGNGTGIDNSTSPNMFYTYGDNRINGNSPDIGGTTGALNTSFRPQ
jgi:hypothetical protein